jgi:DNA-binding NarL/FixJ family response regulator
VPDYTLEYVLQRKADFPSRDNNKRTDLRPSMAAGSKAQEPSAQTATIGGALPTNRIDAVLTPRQRDVFDLIVQGMSNKEIARSLQLAEGTVKIHIKALFAKLGVRRRAAVAVAGTRLLSLSEQGSY